MISFGPANTIYNQRVLRIGCGAKHQEQISIVNLRHELPPVMDKLEHGYMLAQRKAVFYPLPIELDEEANGGSWVLWRFDRGK